MKIKWQFMVFVLPVAFMTAGCQLPYLVSSAYNQVKLLDARRPIPEVLTDPQVKPTVKEKLKLVLKVKDFSVKTLGLSKNKNYTTYVSLHRDAVTYVVQAAPFDELSHYHWHFPIVGDVPYKGFFNLQDAREEAQKFPPEKYDTYIRGVSAYSTLGWFNDPVLSPMLNYSDHDLVEMIIHESVHATLYIASHADFNERMATFLGLKGMQMFYKASEGTDSPTLRIVKKETHDQKLFSDFISKELDSLRSWYKANKKGLTAQKKESRLQEIQADFVKNLKPHLKSDLFASFPKEKLNNALLLTYETYMYNLSDFEKLYTIEGRDFKKTLDVCRTFKDSKDPLSALKAFIKTHLKDVKGDANSAPPRSAS